MIEIRLLTAGDYADVYELWRSTPGMGLNTADDSEAGFRRYLMRNPNTCFAAFSDNRLIGVILAGHDGRRGFIYHTAVLPAFRGQGIGRSLVEHALRALEDEGIRNVALVAFSRNTNGNAFWEALGFEVRDDLVYRNLSLVPLTRIDT